MQEHAWTHADYAKRNKQVIEREMVCDFSCVNYLKYSNS